MKEFKPINFIGDEIYHEPEEVPVWKSVLEGLVFVAVLATWTMVWILWANG